MGPLERLEIEAHRAHLEVRRLHVDRAWRFRLRRIEQDDLLPEELALPDLALPDGIGAAEAAELDLPA